MIGTTTSVERRNRTTSGDDMQVVRSSGRKPDRTQGVANLPEWARRRADLLLSMIVPAVVLVGVFAGVSISAPVGLVLCWLILFLTSYAVLSWRHEGVLAMKDRLATVAVWVGGIIALAPLLWILDVVFQRGVPVIAADFPHFLVSNLTQAGPSDPVTKAGVGNAIIGTLEECGLATVISVPIALLTAIYLDEASRGDETRAGRAHAHMAGLIRMIIDAMNGIPSIIAALVVYLVWVAPHGVNGYSGAAAAGALTIMMLPVVTRTFEENLRIVPGSLREASLALGAPQWRTMIGVIIPTARAGLISGAILGVARAVGETAPTLFTAHGNPALNVNPFHGAQGNLALDIYLLVFSPADNAVREAWGAAAVLVLLVGLLFAIARFIGTSSASRRSKRRRWAGSAAHRFQLGRQPHSSDTGGR